METKEQILENLTKEELLELIKQLKKEMEYLLTVFEYL